MQQPGAPPASEELVLNKIHIRGLDELTSEDIQAYAAEHFSSSKPKLEWVDGEL